MRKGIEKLIDFYNRRQNATYEPYISYLRETELPLRAVRTIDNVAYSVGAREDNDLMKRFISDVRNYGKDVALLGYPDYAVSDDEIKAKIVDFYNHVEYPHNKLYSNLHIIKVRYELSDEWIDDMLNFYEECPSNLSKRAYLHFVSDCAHWSKTLFGSDFIRFGRESFVCNMFLQDVCIFERLNCFNVDRDVDCKLMDVLKYEIYDVKSGLPYYLVFDDATKGIVKHKVCGYDATDIVLHNVSKNPVMNWFYNRYNHEMTNSGNGVFKYDVDNYNEALYKKFLRVSKTVGFTLDSPYFRNSVKIVPDKGVFVKCMKYKKTYHAAHEKTVGYSELSNYSTVSLWFTLDNHVLMDMYAKKKNCSSSHFVPAAINNIYKKQSDNEFLMDMLHDFAADLNFKFLKDVLSDFDSTKHKLATITFNDAVSYHNRREFVHDKYANVSVLQTDFNKVNLNLAYALYKTIRYVDESQYGYLSQIRNLDFIPDSERITSKTVAAVFLKNYYLRYKDYLNKITKKDIIWDDDEDDYIYNSEYDEKLKPWQNVFATCVRDYMSAVVSLGYKVMLNHSIRRIIEDHDELVDNMNLKDYLKRMRGKKLKVPKNSQFNKLRKVLPDDFEWIKTKTRLASESAMQHHCVWQYSDYISSDDSAIYSYVDSDCEFGPRPFRYTIEFKVSRDGYYVAQMQRFRNRGGSAELKKYLNELIKSA